MTVQNTKLSGYNPNQHPSSIPSYLGLPRISSWKKFANLLGLDTPNKLKCDCFCTGRSMVEMLGVLAIIGVLSVGAIAGYGKAMMKYKLNQHAQAVNMLINNVLQLKGQLKFTSDTITHYEELLKKMNLLPNGIELAGQNTLHDIWFKSKITVSYNNQQNGKYQNNFGALSFSFPRAAYGAEICRNIVIAGKENSSNLWQIETQKCDGDNCQKYYGHAFGDAYCGNGYKCLHNLSLDDMSSLCNICDDQNCALHVLWYK